MPKDEHFCGKANAKGPQWQCGCTTWNAASRMRCTGCDRRAPFRVFLLARSQLPASLQPPIPKRPPGSAPAPRADKRNRRQARQQQPHNDDESDEPKSNKQFSTPEAIEAQCARLLAAGAGE